MKAIPYTQKVFDNDVIILWGLKLTDRQMALKLGCCHTNISIRRYKLGLASWRRNWRGVKLNEEQSKERYKILILRSNERLKNIEDRYNKYTVPYKLRFPERYINTYKETNLKRKLNGKKREWYLNNKEREQQKAKEWYIKNKERALNHQKEYYNLNKDSINKKLRENYREKVLK